MRICQARCTYVDCQARGIDQLIPIQDGKVIGLNFTCYLCNRLLLATRKVTVKWWNLPKHNWWGHKGRPLGPKGTYRRKKAEAVFQALYDSLKGIPISVNKERLEEYIKEAQK